MRKTIISLLQFVFFIFSALAGSETLKSHSPYAWSVEKDGKIHYILGTIHAGVSLEELPCSDEVLKQIKMSDLVFVEDMLASIPLDSKDMLELFTGSKEKREEILNNLSAEYKQRIIEIKEIKKRMQEGDKNFENLSKKAKEFLINHGADTHWGYADYFKFIIILRRYEVLFSADPPMDFQVAEIVRTNNIRINGLDDISKIASSLENEIKEDSDPFLVTRSNIEFLVNNHDRKVERMKQGLLEMRELYISGNIESLTLETNLKPSLLQKIRNELWLEKFKKAHESPEYESVFLAAGLGHFVFPFNLIDQLKEEGFSVNRMTCPAD